MKRLLLIAGACLACAACFKSDNLLLDPAAGAHPLADGAWSDNSSEEPDHFTLTANGAGYLRVDGESRDDILLVPLPGHEGSYAAATANEGCIDGHGNECDWDYAVVTISNGVVTEVLPDCQADWNAIQNDVSGRSEDRDTCWFQDGGKLLHALGAVADRGGGTVYSHD